MITTTRAVFGYKVIWVQYIITIMINFGINFFFEYLSLTKAFKEKPHAIRLFTKNDTGSAMVTDILLTGLLLAFFLTVLASKGFRDSVVKRKAMPPIDVRVLSRGVWKYIPPVRVKSLCLRALAQAGFWFVAVTLPFFGLFWAFIGSDNYEMKGLHFCFVKAGFAVFLATFVMPTAFFAACASDKFKDSAHEYLLTGGSKTAPVVDGASLLDQQGEANQI